ncbi:DUF4011 domain-containing protein [Pelomonas sp. UHG3]|uniref:DUF4011 domain-containing protein n=1 Tax=Roseateles hydrophilus TaxID=2975054 RepID=A0ACC6CBJ9_9BURK|nr:DUF4011 domain-containing protein [Pelomonas sp. UHG3]MCY4745655.1 DUF4011 domain-containing protein [Pelomonas sp. UHG3]
MGEGNPYKSEDASKLAGELFNGKLSVAQALERLRTRLLDLTMRNRLLNYRHPKALSVQFTDDPDLSVLFERLVEGKSVPLAYVPDPPHERYDNGRKPDVRVYAREVGIGTSVDIGPSAASTAYKRVGGLQVLQYPVELEKLARKISSEARTVVEETGTNMLYLMFGFLEYFDREDSEKPVHAPLLSVPVNLVRGRIDPESRTYLYELQHSGEDVAENFTLREKFRQQFRLELPMLEEDDSPETYFAKITAAVSKRAKWSVKRRLSLGFLSFGKLAIWADLDPEKSANLLESELLRSIFEGARASPTDAFHAEDYVIDEHPDGELPLIYDADSSQHSAIIDVKHGKSLVINGPPGTGKSQTITNIIATAMAAGKKVLFVSEKLAALEVVKQRLEAAGLGDFCLELHSHKTQKKQLLESIQQRMTRTYRHPAGYEKSLEVLRERRGTLNRYAQLLGSRIGNKLDLTVHELFWAAERRRRELGSEVDGVSGLILTRAASWSAEVIDRHRMTLRDAAVALGELGCLPKDCGWLGFKPRLLVKGDELVILEALEEALKFAGAMERDSDELKIVFSSSPWSMNQLRNAYEPVRALADVARPREGELLERMFDGGLESLIRARAEVSRLSGALLKARALEKTADAALLRRDFADADQLPQAISDANEALSSEGASRGLKELLGLSSQVAEAVCAAQSSLEGFQAIVPSNPEVLLSKLQQARDTPATAPWATVPASELEGLAAQAEAVARETQAGLDQVHGVLGESRIKFDGRVEELQALLDGRGLPELLPEAPVDAATLDELRRLSSSGWQDWTAEQFTQTAREIGELTANAGEASEELKAFFSRIGIPVDLTRAGLEAIEALLTVSVEAPQELLSFRGPGLERPDFPDLAIRAEEANKAVAAKASKVAASFHMDALPDDEELQTHLRVLRRGDGFFNFMKKDWRLARAAFRSCFKGEAKLNASGMAAHFGSVLAWRTAQEEFVHSETFRNALGSLFLGVKTDFNKVRRLNGWLRAGTPALMATDLAGQVNLNTVAEAHLSLLSSNAPRIRVWLSRLRDVSKRAALLPGVDPALARARRIEDLVKPLEAYARSLGASAELLKSTVRPIASVGRAIELLEIRRRLNEHEGVLRALLSAPARLAHAGAALGLSGSPLSYYAVAEGVQHLAGKASVASQLAGFLSAEVGQKASVTSSLRFVESFLTVEHLARAFLASDVAESMGAHAFLARRLAQARSVAAAARLLEPYSRPLIPLRAVVESMTASMESTKALAGITADPSFQKFFGSFLDGLNTDEAALEACITWATAVAGVAEKLPAGVANRLLQRDAEDLMSVLLKCVVSGNESFGLYKAAMDAFADKGNLDWKVWGGAPCPTDAVTRLNKAIAAAPALIPWSKFHAAKDDASGAGLAEVLARAEQGRLNPTALVRGFEYVVYRSIARGILTEHKELARFAGAGHERLRGEFASLDLELVKLNGAMYAAKVDKAKKVERGVAGGRAGDLTEMALLTKETNKQKRHVPIRQLLKRAGKSLQELKPCFMMGPLSVAQYLEPGYLKFDLIVMDEASQLRPEDALGAIARGSQLVVVGDPKQLPPTNFFDRLLDADDEDPEDTPSVVDGVESILGICEHLYRPVRTLRWHYRSKHESLIAFSNAQFYDGRLVVFPSPYQRNRRLGVNYRYVQNGLYQGRRNVPEAQRVVDAVVEHMLSAPEESLGVVTLNQTQRELIEDLLDQKSRDVKGVAEYLERHEKAGWKFFVKNLENVQGDERDVIFVSSTFGKAPGAKEVAQYFGPINLPDGWRRLNVLFTRARRRIDLFTSMLPSDVRVDEKASLGRRAFREYLEYAKTGLLPGPKPTETTRDADSDFELAVADALRGANYDVQLQVGVAGYFIDLGVRHPDRSGEYLAGIECDGVMYHSSLSARDRDRIRQEILELMGWRGRLIRVWSTDWFADPAGQLARLQAFLEQRKVEDQGQPPPFNDADFLPEVELPAETAATENVGSDPSDEGGEVVIVAPPPKTQIFVELGDRVTYEVLVQPPERHTVQLVDSASNLRLGLLNEETPLARALLGLAEGEQATLKIADKPSRELRVVKVER